jgi:hypothetical protein
MGQYEVRHAQTVTLTSFFLVFTLRTEDLRWPLTVMMGAEGVTIAAREVELSASLATSPLSLADAMNSSD